MPNSRLIDLLIAAAIVSLVVSKCLSAPAPTPRHESPTVVRVWRWDDAHDATRGETLILRRDGRAFICRDGLEWKSGDWTTNGPRGLNIYICYDTFVLSENFVPYWDGGLIRWGREYVRVR